MIPENFVKTSTALVVTSDSADETNLCANRGRFISLLRKRYGNTKLTTLIAAKPKGVEFLLCPQISEASGVTEFKYWVLRGHW